MVADKAKFAKQFMSALPHASALGMRLTEMADGKARIEMDYDTRFVGDPDTGVIQWTPTNAQVGTRSVTVRVEDAGSAAATQSFSVNVGNAGLPFAV